MSEEISANQPTPEDQDHDQRLKVLLKEFFDQFFLCFFPVWAARFDFAVFDWMDKEVFLAPPQGSKRQLDLVAKLRLRPDAPPPYAGADELVALVHIEVEGRASAVAFRPRMFEYYVQLRRDTKLPVLPIGLFLRLGLEGIGWDSYEEHFWEHCVLRFDYAYVGLPKLDAEKYVTGEHLLGAALSALMRAPADRRAELHLEALKRIAQSSDNDWRRFLLAECVEAYADFDDKQRQLLQTLLSSKQYEQVRPFMVTTYERGKVEGKVEERRDNALLLLETRFGPVAEEVRNRLAKLAPDQLRQVLLELVKAKSLSEVTLLGTQPGDAADV